MNQEISKSTKYSLWLIIIIMIAGGLITIAGELLFQTDSVATHADPYINAYLHELNVKAVTNIAIALVAVYSLVVLNREYLFICSVFLCVIHLIPLLSNIKIISSELEITSIVNIVITLLITLLSGYSAYNLRKVDEK